MRFGITFWLIILSSLTLSAQHGINDQSPFPADLVVLSPNNLAGTYSYGTQASGPEPEWGPRLSEDVQGELVWGYNSNDSLGCNTGGEILTDLTGKMAFIRRGDCSFVEKVLNAQQAGAVGVVIANHYEDDNDDEHTIIDMRSFDSLISDSVSIPAVFVDRATGEDLQESVDDNESPVVKFDVGTLSKGSVAWSYRMPLSTQKAYRYSVNYFNPNEQDSVDVSITARVVDVMGAEVALFDLSDRVGPLASTTVIADPEDVYVPSEPGKYTVTFKDELSNDSLVTNFEITYVDYGTDVVSQIDDVCCFYFNLTGGGPSQEQYDNVGGVYQSASLVITGEVLNPTVGTYVSFGLTNPQDFFDPFTGGEEFEIFMYQGPFLNNDSTDFGDLTLISSQGYSIGANDDPYKPIFVELDNPVLIESDEIYYVGIRKIAGLGSGISPNFIGSFGNQYRTNFTEDSTGIIYTTPIMLDTFIGTGWQDFTPWIRLHLDIDTGFDRDFKQLDVNQLIIAPNPVQEQLNFTLELNSAVSQALVRILDVNGRLLGHYKFEQVSNAPIQIDVNNLQSGTYFLSVSTPEGYRMKKFVKQ